MNAKLVELLQQMLETELGGVKIYQTALECARKTTTQTAEAVLYPIKGNTTEIVVPFSEVCRSSEPPICRARDSINFNPEPS